MLFRSAELGGGALPEQSVASIAVRVEMPAASAEALAARLRFESPAVIGRVHKGALLLDLRTVFPRQDADLIRVVKAAAECAARQSAS